MVNYWLQNESQTVYLNLDDDKDITLVDGFAITDYVDTTEIVEETWRIWIFTEEQDNAARVTALMNGAERLNRVWRIAADAINRREAENMVWFYQRRHGVERRVLITGGKSSYGQGDWPAGQNNWVVTDTTVKRHPHIEDASLTVVSGNALSCSGGVLVVDKPGYLFSPTTAVSVAPARLARSVFNQPSASLFELQTVWLGIHPGGTAALDPILDLVIGGVRLDGGSGATISFATDNDHQPRAKVSLGTNGGDVSQLRGRWRVLLRAKTTGGAALVTVQLGVGNTYTDEYIEMARDYVNTSGAWQLLEMGEVELPPEGYTPFEVLGTSSTYAGNALFLLAGSENTSMSLEYDRFILIPARHMVKCTGAKVQGVNLIGGGDPVNWADRGLHILTQPDDTQQAVTYRSYPSSGINEFYPSGLVTIEAVDWVMPAEGGVVVIAASRDDDVHNTTDTVSLRMEYYARHYTL